MRPLRIGAYGGTFDPIHRGHIDVASAVVDRFEIDDLLVIPAASPPHKDPRGLSGSHHRFAMAAIATLPLPGMHASTAEIDNPANPYTFETIIRLRASYGPEAGLYFIVGSDSFEEMHTWRRPDLILSNCNLIVAARPGYGMSNPLFASLLRTGSERARSTGEGDWAVSPEAFDESRIIDLTGQSGKRQAFPGRDRTAGMIYLTDYVSADMSSTEIRRRAASGLDVREMVAEGVADYICKYRLYNAGRPAEIL